MKMRLATGAAICVVFGTWFSFAENAAAVSIPAATFVETLSQGDVSDPDPSAPNTLSDSLTVMNGNGSADLTGSASSVGGARPTLTASATANGGASFEMDASVDVVYYFAVSGPASATPIPILITYSGTGSASGPVADGLGSIQVGRLPSGDVISQSLGFSSVFPPATDTFGDTVPVDAPVDALFSVTLHVLARAQAYGGLSQADVTVDPQIEIDPAFPDAGLYAIAYSANIGAPEPSGSLLSLAGIASLALRRALDRRVRRGS